MAFMRCCGPMPVSFIASAASRTGSLAGYLRARQLACKIFSDCRSLGGEKHMSALAESLSVIRKPWQWIAVGGVVLLIWAMIALPSLHQSIGSASRQQQAYVPAAAGFYSAREMKAGPLAARSQADASKVVSPYTTGGASVDRKIIRTSSLEMVVQHPAETAEKINALVESMGGYLVTADDGGPNAMSGTLTIRVPAAKFEEARAQIRKLGLRVENEKVDAQDVTRQYVDQDASIRNLRAEEAQYLTILKQATTVKDMMAVSEKLSEVRGQIEQQEAEFNALSRQIETVAIAISLRTESQAQVFGLNWRPGYQLKLALHDGLESVANYATAMTTILFYLPAVLLWVGTILVAAFGSWRIARWVGRRWFGWKETTATMPS